MWINLDTKEFEIVTNALYHAMASTMHDEAKAVRDRLIDWRAVSLTPLHKHYNQVAFEKYEDEGTWEIDQQSDGTTMVSISDDGGAYVLAWRWIDDEEARICPECGDFPGSDTYGTVGDGYDELCPSCADAGALDDSSVFHVEILDGEYAELFDQHKPWIFETENDQSAFATEEEACAAQREHRRKNNFDEITGERVKRSDK